MIDFDPNTQEAFLSQDLAMKFLVWTAYYNGIVPAEDISFASYGCFSGTDAQRLDRIKDALFKCFGSTSVAGACSQMIKAKQLGETCPFSEASLNELFGRKQ